MVEQVRVLAPKSNNMTSFPRIHTMEEENKLLQVLWHACASHSPHPRNKYMIVHLKHHQFTFSSLQYVGRFLLNLVCVVCLGSRIAIATKTVPEVFLCHSDHEFPMVQDLSYETSAHHHISSMVSVLGKLLIPGLVELGLDLNSPMKHSNQS